MTAEIGGLRGLLLNRVVVSGCFRQIARSYPSYFRCGGAEGN
jgi:hypothetical protein